MEVEHCECCKEICMDAPGVRMELTEEELRLIQESNDGTVIMMNKLKNGEFTINGDSYIPEEEGDDNWWPIPEEINFCF